jgi:hypothetical protein
MITPVAILMAIVLMVYAFRNRQQPVAVRDSKREFVGDYTFYKVNYDNQEQPQHFDSTGTGKFYRSKGYFAFYIEDKAVFVRSSYTSTMNEDKEEHFIFDSDSYAVCYWKQKRLVINEGILNDGRQGYQYELTNFNVSSSLNF